jgi:hypothetical protein
MKNTIRVNENLTKPASSPQVEILRMANALLEPELKEVAEYWSAAKRAELANKFRRWATQLQSSSQKLIRSDVVNSSNEVAQFKKVEWTDENVANVMEEIIQLNDIQRIRLAATLKMSAEFIQNFGSDSIPYLTCGSMKPESN